MATDSVILADFGVRYFAWDCDRLQPLCSTTAPPQEARIVVFATARAPFGSGRMAHCVDERRARRVIRHLLEQTLPAGEVFVRGATLMLVVAKR
jgi:hypothetical protein